MGSYAKRLVAASSALVLTACYANIAWSQTATANAAAKSGQEPAAVEVMEIVVTAQGREQKLQDVPVSVSVVSGDALAKSNLTSLEAVSSRLPNVKITPGPLVDQINVRGVGSGQNAGFEQSVATFLDGVYRARSRATRAALFDVDRVEILKGPQTTFFGANAIAGALNITSRKPSNTFGYNASALYAPSDGEYNLEAGVNLPVNDTLAIRLAGRLSGMDGYVKNDLTGEDGPHDRTKLGRVSIHWTPTDTFTSDFRLDGGRSRTENAYPFELLNCPAPGLTAAATNTCARYVASKGGVVDDKLDGHTTSGDNWARYSYYEAALTNVWDLGSGSLKSVTSYFDHDFTNRIVITPFPVPGSVGGYDGLPVRNREAYNQFSQELRYASAPGGPFEYMVGGYFARSHLVNEATVGFHFLPFGAFNPLGTTNAATPITGFTNGYENDRTLSGFASATIRPTEQFRINLGARYTSIRKQATRAPVIGSAVNADPATFKPFDAITQQVFAAILGADLGPEPNPKRTDSKFMPSIGVQYDAAPGVMLYATYSQGFKAGGYSAASKVNEFGPETVDAYEAGLKGQFLDRRLTTNLAVYRSDYKNLQESTIIVSTAGTIVSLVQNAARSRSQGVELNTSYRVSSAFTLSGDVAYSDSTYSDYKAGACTIMAEATTANCSQDMSGKQRPYAPKWSGNISADIRVPIGGAYELRANPVAYFTTGFFESASADPLLRQKGNTKYDLRVGFGPTDQRWEVSVIGKNLSDEWTAGYRQAVTLAPGSLYAFPDRPRSVAIQFSVKH